MIKMYAEIDLGDGDVRVINDTSLNEVSSKITTATSESGPSFGLAAGVGSLSFKDVNREFIKLSRDGKLTSYIPINIYIGVGENYQTNEDGSVTLLSTPKKSQMVGTWVSDTWSYDVDDSVVTVTLRDVIQDLQQYKIKNTSTLIRVAPFERVTISSQQEFNTIKPYIFNENDGEYQKATQFNAGAEYYKYTETSVADIFDALIEYCIANNNKFNIRNTRSFPYIFTDGDGKYYEWRCYELIREIKPNLCYLDSGSLWSMFDDICNVGMFCMYKDRNGVIRLFDIMQAEYRANV